MSLGALIVVVACGVLLVISAVHYFGGSRIAATRDHGEVILEFARAYPGEAIRSVTMTEDRQASFLRLADGKTGFLQTMGRHHVARLILPGEVTVLPLEGQPGFHVKFHDSTLKGGNYIFASTEDAAEVSLWLCGNFAFAAPKMASSGGNEDA
ncbi:hypothetical protein PZ897_17075 [Hoeflea sp. YIM 152468]|uniref:hypothetical protein n=1 Tax=Hoeflea sp. YIM 152468 TaxID=3031759 RepID=UPI0023DB659A|nr:hypothetical protein [Hoeflea sp. YIM 152468]MDF1609899.1 hypothetical protein [Hoeflea sp. YIM 152468]